MAGLDPAIFFSAEDDAGVGRARWKNVQKLRTTVNETLTVASPQSVPNESTG
jgi:hypothetical protein